MNERNFISLTFLICTLTVYLIELISINVLFLINSLIPYANTSKSIRKQLELISLS